MTLKRVRTQAMLVIVLSGLALIASPKKAMATEHCYICGIGQDVCTYGMEEACDAGCGATLQGASCHYNGVGGGGHCPEAFQYYIDCGGDES